MENSLNIVEKAEKYVEELLNDRKEQLPYHNLNHALEVKNAALKIGTYANLAPDELEILLLAALFHDTGFSANQQNHEEKSMELANSFLTQEQYDPEKIDKVLSSIHATKESVTPKTLIERVLHDADFYHLSKKSYFDKVFLLKTEIEAISGKKISDADWHEENLRFLQSHKYYTEYGKTVLGPKVEKNIRAQQKMLRHLGKMHDEALRKDMEIDPERVKELKKKLKKVEGRPSRGIETMFRLTSRNHLQLSSMADSKANILISVNSIIISIIISGLIKTLDNHPHLVIPTYIILTINVVTIVFAILALRPNVTEGKFTRKDIEEKNTNLLFFGNFHGMARNDYKWGMVEMMNDSDYLYSSLIDDIYFLGKVLGKKYRFLRFSYNIFMYGMVVAVIAFVIANIYYISGLTV